MRTVTILAEEHRGIAYVLGCLEQLIQKTLQSDSLDGEAAVEILEYLEHVADGSHQDKEELVLFPMLLKRTSDDVRPSVEWFLGNHERERHVLEQLRSNLEGAAYGDPVSQDSFVVFAREYVTNLSEHARWEDKILLPLVEQNLDERDDAEMLDGFRAVEERCFPGERSPCRILDRIRRRFGVVERAPDVALPLSRSMSADVRAVASRRKGANVPALRPRLRMI